MFSKVPSQRSLVVLTSIAVLLLIAGVIGVNFQLSGQQRRNEIRNNGQKTTAIAVNRKEVEFDTPEGKVKGKPIVQPATGTFAVYDAVDIYYDKSNPSRFILAQSDSAFVITMWIASMKLIVSGLVIMVIVAKRHKQRRNILPAKVKLES